MPARLKSLELHGYKTFASRTLFEFSEKVTAIVGPNGSGKSNIADSLRWVLGEQSYSLLRGKKTEDMIFSGSEHRPRAGMASATITFDNCDGWLPIDFSEVAITRRAYRDGQNEYLINRQRVRLKDVSELLAQSGLAERTYTIIGQGLVDAALALKAEERRRLFEEAAGTGLHRSRREEALRRLETTRRNLDRVQDILAELQPRLRSLERQARRAQEYEQVKADLKVVLREWYGFHWHRAQMELSESREAAHAQEASLEQARREQLELEEQVAAWRERAQGLRASLNSWHRQSALLHTRWEALSRDLAVADERKRSLEERLQNTRAELNRLQEELSLHQERFSAAGQEVERLRADWQEASREAETAHTALSARQAEREQAEKDFRARRQDLSALQARQGQLQARLSERQSQLARGRQSLEEAARAMAAAGQEVEAARGRRQSAEEARGEAENACRRAEEELLAYRQKLAGLEAERKEHFEQLSAAEADLARRQAQLDVLEQAETALSGYSEGARLLLQAAREQRLEGVRGALSSQLEVPAELETAIAAALSEYLDAVLLDPDPEQALELLSRQARRGVLLPLKSLQPSAPLNQAERDGILGVAADLVKSPPEFRPAVDLLLGQALIVRDRQAAKAALAKMAQHEAAAAFPLRAVTLKGEVFLASGPVWSAGSGAPPEDASGASQSTNGGQTVLSRQRQRREARRRLEETADRESALRIQIAELEGRLKDLQGAGEQIAQAQRQARQGEEQAALAARQVKLEEEQAARQQRWQQEQWERLQAELRGGEAESQQLEAQLAQIETEISQQRDEVRQRSARLAELTLEEYQAQVSHWDTRHAVAERAFEDSQRRLRERQAALEQARNAIASRLARQVEFEQSLAALEEGKTTQRQAESQAAEEIEALRALIEPAEAELEQAEKELSGLQNQEATARQALSQAEHHHAQARIQLNRRQEALESLQRRIEDDFGLVAFEYREEVSGPTPLPLEGMVEQLPMVSELSPEIEETIKRQRAQLHRMGAINPEARAEYQEVKQRFSFLTGQVADLQKAEADVRQVIAELDALMEREFRKTFEAVAAEFKEIFTRLFGGGSAQLVLTDPDDLTDTGIDIEARLPGRRTQGLSLLSGGERSLTAAALVFALLKVSPTPFCVLDEVDAMLDEANVGRFRDLLRELSENTQFVVVTHNRNTVQAAEVIYGVTMSRDSASQVISLKLDEVGRVVEP